MRLPTIQILLFLFLLAGASGCSDRDGDDDLRLHVETLSIDGPVPEGLVAVYLAPDGSEDGRFPLLAVPDGRPGEYRIDGGPEGAYRVDPPPGWGIISAHTVPPEVKRGRTPPVVRLGRVATVYLGPLSPTLRPGPTWGAERIDPDGSRSPLPVETDVVPPGYGVGIRFDPKEWHGRIEVFGFLALGIPGALSGDDAVGPLAEPLRIHVPVDRGPVVGTLRAAPTADLQAIPVPASSTLSVEGRDVVVELMGIPVEVRRTQPVHRGAARFRGLPDLEEPLWVGMGEAGDRENGSALLPLSAAGWGRSSQFRFLFTGDLPLRALRVKLPPGVTVEQVQVRPAGAVAYGRVPFDRAGDELVLQVPEGALSLLLGAATWWSIASVEGIGDRTIEAPPFVEGVKVDGNVRGATPATEIRFFRRVSDDAEEAVLADGFVVQLTRFGVYEALLPVGTYVVEVADEQGVERRPSPLEATAPGAAIHLPLHAHGH